MLSCFIWSCFMLSFFMVSCFMVSPDWANAAMDTARKHIAISLLVIFFTDISLTHGLKWMLTGRGRQHEMYEGLEGYKGIHAHAPRPQTDMSASHLRGCPQGGLNCV